MKPSPFSIFRASGLASVTRLASLQSASLRLAFPAVLAALTLGATSANAQSGSATWTGAVDGDYFNAGNWSPAAWPNGNATFSGTTNTNITHTPSGGESPYVFGLLFTNSLSGEDARSRVGFSKWK